jgi:predicted dehydrogenase
MEWSRGRGADTVIITAGAHGDSRIIRSVPERCRDRATVVAVGDVGLDLDRNAFYYKELDLKVARSYGPGRYDRSYEEWGVDYPIGHVRWTEGRNLEAVLDLMSNGRLDVADLITHRFSIDDASDAYAALDDSHEAPIGIVLTYDQTAPRKTTIAVAKAKRPSKRSARPNVGIVGVGAFVKGVIVPALKEAGSGPIVHVASSSGVTAARFAERHGVAKASSDAAAVIADDAVDLVIVATPHSTHAEVVIAALDAGKDVYCEKPLALDDEELAGVEGALAASSGRLYVGFNRRYSAILGAAKAAMSGTGPMQIEYRVNAGKLAAEHWYSDHREGGRLIGEVSHFIDACSYLVGDLPVCSVDAIAPASAHHDSYHVLIGYDDGSSASIVYSDGSHPSVPKERIEINGRGHTVLLDNYRSLTIDGAKAKVAEGKGHAAGIAAFISGDLHDAESTALATTRITLAAVASLRS